MERYLTTAEVAKIVRRSPQTLRNWRHQGTGPQAIKTQAGGVLYPESAVEAWMKPKAEAGATA